MRRVILTIFFAVLLIGSQLSAFNWKEVNQGIEKSLYHLTTVDGITHYSCTAFSINQEKGYVLTAAHCMGGDELKLDGEPALMVYGDEQSDLAVLKSTTHKPSLKYNANPIFSGEDVSGAGYAWGFNNPTFKSANVATPDQVINELKPGEHFLVVDSAWVGGMSGGPVYDSTGKIVSIIQNGDPDNFVGIGRTIDTIIKKTAKFWEGYEPPMNFFHMMFR